VSLEHFKLHKPCSPNSSYENVYPISFSQSYLSRTNIAQCSSLPLYDKAYDMPIEIKALNGFLSCSMESVRRFVDNWIYPYAFSWCAWHLHDDGKAVIRASVMFLQNRRMCMYDPYEVFIEKTV
jgi:hypothetical protein